MVIRDNNVVIPYYSLFVDIRDTYPISFICEQGCRKKKSENSSEWDKIKKYGDEINDKTRSNKKK